jgi:hypothetical protein
VLSFGRSKKPSHPDGGVPTVPGEITSSSKRESVAGSLVRKLSFGKKKTSG